MLTPHPTWCPPYPAYVQWPSLRNGPPYAMALPTQWPPLRNGPPYAMALASPLTSIDPHPDIDPHHAIEPHLAIDLRPRSMAGLNLTLNLNLIPTRNPSLGGGGRL